MVDDACYDSGILFFGEHGFWMTRLLNPNIVGNWPFCFCMILVVYLDRAFFHSEAVTFFSKSVIGRDLKLLK